MALVENRYNDDRRLTLRDSFWDDDRWMRDWEDWPRDWPQPRELMRRFRSDFDRRGSLDWPSDWPNMDAVVPRFSSHLDRMDRNWRSDPFWRDLYPRWAEPIFKEGIDIKSKIVNDNSHFAVDVDAYQFRPEEIQVKTVDDTLLIEGRHEDVRDRDNFTKMYFVRKYQLPADIDPVDITSSIDGTGRLTVEAQKRQRALAERERVVPIEGPSRRGDSRASRSNSNSPRDRNEAERISPRSQPSPQTRSHSSSYFHRETKTTGGSPQDSFQDRNQYSPRNNSGDHQRDRMERERIERERIERERMERERDYRSSESRNEYRTESRQGSSFQDGTKYRVESPATTTYSQHSGRQNGGGSYSGGLLKTAEPPRAESRSESVRSVQILRKTFG